MIVLILIFVLVLIHFDIPHLLTLESLKSQRDFLLTLVESQFFTSLAVFSLIYVLVAALSIPGATVLTLAAGFMFGTTLGTILVSFVSTVGACCAFLVSRFVLRSWVEERFQRSLEKINAGFAAEGDFYLFSLRLIPVFPFFLVNLLVGLTRYPLWKFFLISQVGMLPATWVYVQAGSQLAHIQKLSDVMSVQLWGAFALIGILPLVSRKMIRILKK